MAIQSIPDLVTALRDSSLLDPKQADVLADDLASRFDDARDLSRELVLRGWVTAYQINQLVAGRGQDLILGSYVLLHRLGEGGMGQVFKARHRKMNRAVALKVIRRDKLGNPEAIRRFFREVQAVATLDHPNIVQAFDAGEAGSTYYFAMEYVEGRDLGRMIKQKGPLKLGKACEYIRQAALGLQHAHEKGMVHRDIKPSNIIVRGTGSGSEGAPLVKILDMGLARVGGPLADDGGGEPLTQVHAVLGTPDFIAPEQAQSSHGADIRSDLYSLGCTFYYVLTGQVPFPVESPMEKLLKHYMEPPPAVEALRPEVPRGISRVVRQLMAKSPDERPQTPAELAYVLGTMVGARTEVPIPLAIPVGPALPEQPAEPPPSEEPPADETLPEVSLEFATSDSINLIVRAKRRPRDRAQRRRLMTFSVLGAAIGLMVALVALLLRYAMH
jgi:serine/threonine-protein kinase